MTRRILLTLADDTTETECGDCRWNDSYWYAPDDFGGTCRIYGGRDDGSRVPECLAAEQQATPEQIRYVAEHLRNLIAYDEDENEESDLPAFRAVLAMLEATDAE